MTDVRERLVHDGTERLVHDGTERLVHDGQCGTSRQCVMNQYPSLVMSSLRRLLTEWDPFKANLARLREDLFRAFL